MVKTSFCYILPMDLSIAFSPCPNDTFMFHDVATGALRLDGFETEIHLHDVQTLNDLAEQGRYDITKLSCHAYLRVQEQYQLLGVGAALGFDCGPLIVARNAIKRSDLAHLRLAVPGKWTTAHLLARLWAPEITDTLFVRYDEVMDCVLAGHADAGIIIHESRFVYRQLGLLQIVDLGSWWQDKTQLPIPLGCVAARRDLGADTIAKFESLLKRSIENSMATPDDAPISDFVRQHAREMDENVLRKHIKMFVNEYSLDLGDQGRAAFDMLGELAAEAGVIS